MRYYERLRDLREDRDLEQKEIATILNKTQQQISKYEKGLQMMGIDKYIKLAIFYNVSIDYLVGIIDTPKPLEKTKSPLTLTKKQTEILEAYERSNMKEAIDRLLEIK